MELFKYRVWHHKVTSDIVETLEHDQSDGEMLCKILKMLENSSKREFSETLTKILVDDSSIIVKAARCLRSKWKPCRIVGQLGFCALKMSLEESDREKISTILSAIVEQDFQAGALKAIQGLHFNSSSFALLNLLISGQSKAARDLAMNEVLLRTKSYEDSEVLEVLKILDSILFVDFMEHFELGEKALTFVENNFDAIFRKIDDIVWKDVSIYAILTVVERLYKKNAKPYCDALKIFDRTFNNYVFDLGAKKIQSSIRNNFKKDKSFPKSIVDQDTNENIDEALGKNLKTLSKAPKDLKVLDRALYLFYKSLPKHAAWNTEEIKLRLYHTTSILRILMTIDDPEAFNSHFDSFLYSVFSTFSLNGDNSEWMDATAEEVFYKIESNTSRNREQAHDMIFLKLTRYPSRCSWIFSQSNKTSKFLKNLLLSEIFEAKMLTREEEIEQSWCDQIKNIFWTKFVIKKRLRLTSARFLSDINQKNYQKVLDKFSEKCFTTTAERTKYSHCSIEHRRKLHFLQAMVHLEVLSTTLRDILVYEMTKVYNHPNVLFLIEIILGFFDYDVLELLEDDSLKAAALKSILTVASLQIRKITDYSVAKSKTVQLQDDLMPLTFHKLLAVRVHAQVALLRSCEHVKKLAKDQKESFFVNYSYNSIVHALSGTEKTYFDVVYQDFRFTVQPDELFTVESLYHFIPKITKMPVSEIIEREPDLCLLGSSDVNRWIRTDWDLKKKMVYEVENDILNLTKHIKYEFSNIDERIDTLPELFFIEIESNHLAEGVFKTDCITKHEVLGDLAARQCRTLESGRMFTATTKTYDFVELKKFLMKIKHRGYEVVKLKYGKFGESTGTSDGDTGLEIAKMPKKCVVLIL